MTHKEMHKLMDTILDKVINIRDAGQKEYAHDDQDVFANAVGGVRINETGADLAILLAVLGSFRDRVLPRDLIVFGELGLTGELRPVANGQERLREASKHGFKHAIVPFANRPKERIGNMTIHGVKTLAAALEVVSSL